MAESRSEPAAPASQYPQHWEADVLLADGGTVHIRPSGPADTEALRAMHFRSSGRTRYLRYFSAVNEVSDSQLAIFTDIDHDSRVGLVAELGGDLIAAGTYHRAAGSTAAEVAFLVEDAHQRRGLGSILLEHLAAAARERGITKFTAEVLTDNSSMLRVFIDAGYVVTREFSQGVVEVVFDIAPTEASRSVSYSREQRAEARSIQRLLSPRSVAVIGASNDKTKIGHAVLMNLLRAGFTGPVFPVHPEARSVQGVRAYARVTDIPDAVDLAVVAVPAGNVNEVVESCRAKGVHALVVVTAGFAEAGSDGADAQRRLVTLARAHGMRVLGPNCLGLVNTDPAVRLNATLAPVVPPPGRVGFFCQSGALGIAILADAASRGLGLSTFASAGNRADVSGNDLLQYWYDDVRTEVVMLYLESFGNPRKFARLARVLAGRKPVIAMKSGRHALVTPGLALSSAAISEASVGTLFAQSGVIRVNTLAEAFDVALLMSTQPLPTGNRVAIIGNSTALGVLALDACIEAGLLVAGGEPVDLGVAVSPEVLAATVEAALADGIADAVVVVYVPPVATPGLAHAAALRAAVAGATIPVVSTFLAVEGVPAQLAVIDDHGGAGRGSVPSYRTPERAVAALAHAARYAAWRQRDAGQLPALEGLDRGRARELVDAIRACDASDGVSGQSGAAGQSGASRPDTRALTDGELVDILGCYRISIADFELVSTKDQAVAAAAVIGYPVGLKAFDESWRHRTDQIGVRLNLRDPHDVKAAYADLAAQSDGQVYVQAMAPVDMATVSTVFEVTSDPSFGALVSFGLGGVATELLDDRAYRTVPLTDVDAAELIEGPRTAPILHGYRGSEPVDIDALQMLALRLSALADDLPEVVELRLRPVLVGPAGLQITGALGRIGRAPAQVDPRRRMPETTTARI
ncbi:GNAT family N-acetyltransferase [Nakamurella antarctica]|uniref:GNAT family N-acetyltransferase n=1 Tax=Nakamurella antarctica TaxID=1902245 RepID=A0A3G8ZVI0_9ACTN|nr:bifunctional GNAT family N-acetyltransferase/acetate--CoA ligase family protein [Nakamurella antarctica]AZI57681.1 GNAT family N-acetyltransferase [Nakamurella antarctica]